MSNWKVVTDEPEQKSAPMQSNWHEVPYEDNQESAWKRIPRDVLIGLTHAGRNLHNLPHDLSKLAEWPAEKIAGPLKHPLSSYLPYDPNDYADVWGQKGKGTTLDNALQKGVEIAPDVIGGINALRSLKILPHLTRKGASKTLNKAKQLGIDRDMNALLVNPESIEDLRQFLPNTAPYRNLINEAHKSISNVEKNMSKIPIEKYDAEGSNLYGFTHNSSNTILPSNNLGLIKEGNNARVISAVVDPKVRNTGIGKSLYKEAIDDAIKRGLNFVSDSIVSEDAMRVYKSLEKEGYKFEYNPLARKEIVDGKTSLFIDDPDQSVIKLISKPVPKKIPNNYQILFDLQSDVGKHAGALTKDWFSKANRLHGYEGMEARRRLINEMKNSLRKEGHGDIADLLTKGQDEYRRYMKFKPYRNALMAAGAAYALPRNVLIDLAKKLATMKSD